MTCHHLPLNRDYILCHQCDLLIEMSDMAMNEHRVVCPRCNAVLLKRNSKMKKMTLIYAICTLFLLCIASSFAFVNIRILGNTTNIGILEIPSIVYHDNYGYISLLFLFFVLILPILMLLTLILLCANKRLSKYKKRDLLMFYKRITHWCMPEIFLIGVIVSFVKLQSYGEIGVNAPFFAFCLAIIFLSKTMISFSSDMFWLEVAKRDYSEPSQTLTSGKTGASQHLKLCHCCHAILPVDKARCPRCKTKSKLRGKKDLQRILALLMTSVLLYIPANIFGIMATVFLGSSSSSTIMDGVIYMWQSGDYPVALVIFSASIIIPIWKIISLGCLCHFAMNQSAKPQTDCLKMNKLYRAVEFIGKWSMIDIFVVVVIVSLIRNGAMMSVHPDIGIVFFATVVIVTMIASQRFDPRLLWDKVQHNNHNREQ